MPVVTQYTEATLRPWLMTELGDVAAVLGWDAGHVQIDAALVDTTRLLQLTDVADAPDAGQVERLAAVAVWRRAWGSLAARYEVAEDQQVFKRNQMFDMVAKRLALAESLAADDLAATDPSRRIRVDVLDYVNDPYQARPCAGSGW